MKNKLTNNLGLKLASVFLAVVLWLVVISINDPTTTQPFYNVPVTLLNTDLITDSGQVYEVLDNTDVINRVVVRAPHSVLSELKEENIIATADVGELSSLDTISIKLSTNLSAKDSSRISSITGNIDTVKLKIENKNSKALALKATTSGEVEDGYMVGDITPDQNLVRISGPQSVIDRIFRAAVDVDVTGMTSDIVTNAEIKLYDINDKEITDTSNITQNIKTVGVKVAIWKKAAIPLVYSVGGNTAVGYRATEVTDVGGNMVEVAGKPSALRNLSAITIPAEALDITDLKEDLVAEIDIRQYLPDNVFLANAEDAVRTVTVRIEKEISKRMEIREERVRITNIPEGYEASISGLGESFVIEAIGLSEDVAGLQASAISGIVDVQEWMEQQGMTEPAPGFYTVTVDFGLPENVSLRENVTVELHISEIEEEIE